jgi:hypothetical protein
MLNNECGYVCLSFQPISDMMNDSINWTNFECHVQVQTKKECKNDIS